MNYIITLKKFFNIGNIFTNGFIIVIVFGCAWQSIKLIHIYTSYPTKIEIVTKFDLYEDVLASLTFCKKTDKHYGIASDDLFQYYKNIKFIYAIYFDYDYVNSSTNDNGFLNMTIMISLDYFCFILKGILCASQKVYSC